MLSKLQADGDWGSYLLSPVNLHRIPIIFGVQALDIQVLGSMASVTSQALRAKRA